MIKKYFLSLDFHDLVLYLQFCNSLVQKTLIYNNLIITKSKVLKNIFSLDFHDLVSILSVCNSLVSKTLICNNLIITF